MSSVPRKRRRLRRAGLVAIVAAAVTWAVWPKRSQQGVEMPGDWRARVGVLAGDGIPGARDGRADRARFGDPFGVVVAADGTVFVADGGERPGIRRIAVEGFVTTLAGGEPGFADGKGTAARFESPSALAIDPSGALVVADTGNNAIRRVTLDGRVSTIAGDGTPGWLDGPAATARFNGPVGIAVGRGGTVFVTDTYNDRLRTIDADGYVRTVELRAAVGSAGSADFRRLDTPCGIAVDAAGTLLVADTGHGLIRSIDVRDHVTTLGGPLTAVLDRPIGVAVAPSGHLYITEEAGRVIERTADGHERIVAGSAPGYADGDGMLARFRRPSGLAWAAPGRLVVADTGNALLRTVSAVSAVTDVPEAPASPRVAPRFNARDFGLQPLLWPIDPLEGPHEVAGTPGEARGGEGEERFHAGLDIRGDEGTVVRAVRPGVVSAPIASSDFGSINEGIRVGPVAYVHLRVGRSGRATFDDSRFVWAYDDAGRPTRVRVKRGARFSTGDAVGTINAFSHVHLNVGWPGDDYNPLAFHLVGFRDTVPPTITRGGIRVYDRNGQRFEQRLRGRLVVKGQVQVVVDAWDQADGNRPGRRLGLHELGYRVLSRDGSPAPGFERPRASMRFDRLTADVDAPRLVYAPGSGIPFYGRRATRFLYIVTNTFLDGKATEGAWDTGALTPGDYTLRVIARDAAGNEAIHNRDVAVTIGVR